MREMKDSGIEWIGEIPIEWKISPVKRFFKNKKRIVGSDVDKYERLALTMNGVIKRSKNDSEGLQPKKFEEYQILKKNEIVFKLIDLENVKTSRVGLSPYTGLVSPAYIIITNGKEDNRFFYYWFMFMYYNEVFNHLGGEGVRSALNAKDVLSLPVPNIGNIIMKSVSDYLDDKCTKIDTIIEKQQKIIEKLKAYKLSLITETVTKGMNPDVKVKDSGYEFIGTVPEHWNICRLRNIGIPQNGISKGGNFFGHGYPFVSYGDVYRNFSLPETMNGLVETTEEEREQYSVKEGDIFFTRTSETIEEVGFSCVCEKTIENATFAGFVIRVRPFVDDLVTGFAKYYFRSNHHRFYLVKEMNLVTRASLGQNLLKSMPVLLPPKKEQQEIANYLDKKCAAIDLAIEKKQALIEKLTEYKKSLIYEVVTGKKDIYTSENTVTMFCPVGIPTNEEEYAKILLVQKIITRCGKNLKGRTHLMKIFHALELEIGFSFHSEYTRYFYGPYDKNIEKYESELVRKGWIKCQKGTHMTYRVVNSTAYKTDYNRIFAKYNKEIERIIDFFKEMTHTSKAEKVATLLASWNDFLIDGIMNPTDDMIITDVMNNWTDNKANSKYSTWQTILDSMKKNKIIPHGYGRHTIKMEV